jgi:hypothetical protein
MKDHLERRIAADVAFCKAMAGEMEDYLSSNVLFWEPSRRRFGGGELPKLTIGGLLLALRRLTTLRERLDPAQTRALAQAGEVLDRARSQRRVRYETKLERDLRSRLDAWAWYLDDMERSGEAATAYYPRQVENRTKIGLLLDDARDSKMSVVASRQRQAALDERLRQNFESGAFVWPDALQPGFPAERFWYLWGRPRKDQ